MAQLRDAQGRFVRLSDGLANLASGAGTTADKRAHSFYATPFVSPQQIEAAYRSSWMMRKGVDLPPFDMTRGGRDWQLDEASVSAIEREEKRLGVWAKLRQALVLGRLGGGLILTGLGSDVTVPITQAERRKGGLAYLCVLNRWQVSLGPVVNDPADPLFGQPQHFQFNGASGVKVHPSRVITFRGKQVPALMGAVGADDWFWGDSLAMSALNAVKNAEAALNGFASLIEEAKLDTVTIPGLTQLVSTSEGEALVTKRVQVANLLKSTHNTRILDGGRGKDAPGETWDTRQVTWTGMPDIIRVYAATVAGAFDIPATRFLGKAPDGMNATGSGDEANYLSKIAADQDAELRPALDQLDTVLLPSAGVTVTDEAWYSFPPLHELSELDKATAFGTKMTALVALQNTGTIPDLAFAKAMQHTAVEEQWLDGLDGALAEMPEDERFPSAIAEPKPDPVPPADPNAQPEGGDSVAPGGGGDGSAPVRWAANDARPRTLYVSRKVLNTADIAVWAKTQGIADLADDLHVTIAYSTTPVDWIAMGADWRDADGKGGLMIAPGGPRVVEPIGNMTAALLFASSDLTYRNMTMREAGASWDHPDYQPHISLTKAPIDAAKVEPYRGRIVLGPEVFEEVDPDA